jgi:hypothetical protein
MSRRRPDLNSEIGDVLAGWDFVRNNNFINAYTWGAWKDKKSNKNTTLTYNDRQDINGDGINDFVVRNKKKDIVAVNGWQLKKTDYPYRNLMKARNTKDRDVKGFIKEYYQSNKYDPEDATYKYQLDEEQQRNELRFKEAHLSRAPPKVMSAMRYFQTFIFKPIYDQVFPSPAKDDFSTKAKEARKLRKWTVPFLRASQACFRHVRRQVIDFFLQHKNVNISDKKEVERFICELKESADYKKVMLNTVLKDEMKEKLGKFVLRALKNYAMNPDLMEPGEGDEVYSVTWASSEQKRKASDEEKRRRREISIPEVKLKNPKFAKTSTIDFDFDNPEHVQAALNKTTGGRPHPYVKPKYDTWHGGPPHTAQPTSNGSIQVTEADDTMTDPHYADRREATQGGGDESEGDTDADADVGNIDV